MYSTTAQNMFQIHDTDILLTELELPYFVKELLCEMSEVISEIT